MLLPCWCSLSKHDPHAESLRHLRTPEHALPLCLRGGYCVVVFTIVWCVRTSVAAADILEPVQFAGAMLAALPHTHNDVGTGAAVMGANQSRNMTCSLVSNALPMPSAKPTPSQEQPSSIAANPSINTLGSARSPAARHGGVPGRRRHDAGPVLAVQRRLVVDGGAGRGGGGRRHVCRLPAGATLDG